MTRIEFQVPSLQLETLLNQEEEGFYSPYGITSEEGVPQTQRGHSTARAQCADTSPTDR